MMEMNKTLNRTEKLSEWQRLRLYLKDDLKLDEFTFLNLFGNVNVDDSDFFSYFLVDDQSFFENSPEIERFFVGFLLKEIEAEDQPKLQGFLLIALKFCRKIELDNNFLLTFAIKTIVASIKSTVVNQFEILSTYSKVNLKIENFWKNYKISKNPSVLTENLIKKNNSNNKRFLNRQKLLKTQKENEEIELAYLFERIAEMFEIMENFKDSQMFLIECLYIYQNYLGIDNPRVANCHLNLAISYTISEKFESVENHYTECIKIYKIHFEENHEIFAKIYTNFAIFYLKQFELNKAKDCFDYIKNLSLDSVKDELKIKYYSNFSIYLSVKGQYKKAFDLSLKTLKLLGFKEFNLEAIKMNFEKIKCFSRLDCLSILLNFSVISCSIGNFDDAKIFIEFCKMSTKNSKYLMNFFCKVLENKGILLTYQEKYDDALEIFEESLKISKNLLNVSYFQIYTIYFNIAHLYLCKENTKYAFSYLKNVKKLLQSYKYPDICKTWYEINKGIFYILLKDYNKAKIKIERSLNDLVFRFGEIFVDIGILYANLGVIDFYLKNYTKAIQNHKKAEKMLYKELLSTHPHIYIVYLNLATIYKFLCMHDDTHLYLEKLNKNLQINKKDVSIKIQAQVLLKMAELYRIEEKYNMSKDILDNILYILDIDITTYQDIYIDLLLEYSTLYIVQEEYDLARERLETGLKIMEESSNIYKSQIAIFNLELAKVEIHSRRFELSSSHIERCEAIFYEIYDYNNHLHYFNLHSIKAFFLSSIGNFKEAIENYLNGLSVYEKYIKDETDEKAMIYYSLAECFFILKNYDDAKFYVFKSVDTFKNFKFQKQLIINTYELLARILVKLNLILELDEVIETTREYEERDKSLYSVIKANFFIIFKNDEELENNLMFCLETYACNNYSNADMAYKLLKKVWDYLESSDYKSDYKEPNIEKIANFIEEIFENYKNIEVKLLVLLQITGCKILLLIRNYDFFETSLSDKLESVKYLFQNDGEEIVSEVFNLLEVYMSIENFEQSKIILNFIDTCIVREELIFDIEIQTKIYLKLLLICMKEENHEHFPHYSLKVESLISRPDFKNQDQKEFFQKITNYYNNSYQ